MDRAGEIPLRAAELVARLRNNRNFAAARVRAAMLDIS
jgi:hypothetical protein